MLKKQTKIYTKIPYKTKKKSHQKYVYNYMVKVFAGGGKDGRGVDDGKCEQ